MRVLGRALSHAGLLLERHRAGVAVARPRGENQQEAGIGPRSDRAALGRIELEEMTGACRRALPSGRGDVDLALDDDDPRPLVHLVLLQLLTAREMQHDRPRIVSRGEDLRLVRLRLDGLQVPALHRQPPSASQPFGGLASNLVLASRSDSMSLLYQVGTCIGEAGFCPCKGTSVVRDHQT
jgi:hypothetical protein